MRSARPRRSRRREDRARRRWGVPNAARPRRAGGHLPRRADRAAGPVRRRPPAPRTHRAGDRGREPGARRRPGRSNDLGARRRARRRRRRVRRDPRGRPRGEARGRGRAPPARRVGAGDRRARRGRIRAPDGARDRPDRRGRSRAVAARVVRQLHEPRRRRHGGRAWGARLEGRRDLRLADRAVAERRGRGRASAGDAPTGVRRAQSPRLALGALGRRRRPPAGSSPENTSPACTRRAWPASPPFANEA